MKHSAYILAGGKSSRMGKDKGLLVLSGKTFVEHIYAALEPIFGKKVVIISSNSEYDFLGLPRIEDIFENKGPIGGIFTALEHSTTKINLIVSVDVPFVSTELLQWLLDNHKADFLLTQICCAEKTHPLIAVYDAANKSLLEEYLSKNKLKLIGFVNDINHQNIEIPLKWTQQIRNINTQEEYKNCI